MREREREGEGKETYKRMTIRIEKKKKEGEKRCVSKREESECTKRDVEFVCILYLVQQNCVYK